MLTKIREKSQGTFAWVILILICVPFALWGIQNYIGGGSETALVSVGDKDFFQQDLNQAYSQYTQNLQGMNFDEERVKQQAIEKLIQDEVLFQYVQDTRLVATDNAAKSFIQGLEYFQSNGQFDKEKFKALLAGQRMTSKEFVGRIKKALIMEQFQRSMSESSFVTQADLDNFFRIQNQQRDVELVTIAKQMPEQPPEEAEITNYYQDNQQAFQTDEKVSIEYVILSLDQLAQKIEIDEVQLDQFYQDQQALYTSKERRRISHILFAFNQKDTEEDQLEKAKKVRISLQNKSFSALASEISDDKLSAKKGGDLGLFNVGEMDKAFEEAAASLGLDEVSEPVRSEFGYHLIKVTELTEGEVKPLESVREEVVTAYKRAQAENSFYEQGEMLTELSYENPDSLQFVADSLELSVEQSDLFGRNAVLLNDQALPEELSLPSVIDASFSADVLQGNNSEVIEINSEMLLVLRLKEHKPSATKPLAEVKSEIIAKLSDEKAVKLTKEKADKLSEEIEQGLDIASIKEKYGYEVQTIKDMTRSNGEVDWQLSQEIFKVAKPRDGKPTLDIFSASTGDQVIINLLAVKEGEMTESDRKKQKLAEMNMSRAFGQSDFSSVMNSLRNRANITINIGND